MFFDEKYTAHAGADCGMNLTETDPTEQEARRVPLEMFYKGMGLVGLMYGNAGELIFYDSALIAPIADIVKYYGGIPEAIKLLKRERDALEDEYNGLGGLAMDGMPHSSAPGNPTEALAVRVIENGVKNRLQEISVQVEVLEGDAANIRGALDAVNGKYKSVIIMRLIRGYSWTKISGKLGVPDSTARNWHGRAVERLGEVLEDVPMVDELTERATRART